MQQPSAILVFDRDRDDMHHSIMVDLKFLIAQVDASIVRVEQAMGREAARNEEGSAATVVLDDVTPLYLAASAALAACKSELDLARQALHDAGVPEDGTGAASEHRRDPAR